MALNGEVHEREGEVARAGLLPEGRDWAGIKAKEDSRSFLNKWALHKRKLARNIERQVNIKHAVHMATRIPRQSVNTFLSSIECSFARCLLFLVH